MVGSFDWCKRSQTIDLHEKGFSTEVMDCQRPPIRAYEWYVKRMFLYKLLLFLVSLVHLPIENMLLEQKELAVVMFELLVS